VSVGAPRQQVAGEHARRTALPDRGDALRRLRQALPDWSLRPEFLAVLLLGAGLRLVFPGQTTFLGDQAELLALARSALEHHALPITGIRSSIGTLNLPASIYLLLPFALLSDPRWAALGTALANTAALIILYALANRYLGRYAAFTASLLYATAGWVVYFSRFIWQQNLLAPVVLLFVWTYCRGVLDGRRGWLGWNVLLWGIAAQLHPSAAPLLALTAAGVAVTWRHLRPRDVAAAAAALALLFFPAVIWEVMSHGSDIAAYQAFEAQPATLTLDAPGLLLSMLGPQNALLYGPGTLYSRAFPAIAWLTPLLDVLFLASVLWGLAVLLVGVPWPAGLARRLDRPRIWLADAPDWRFLVVLALWLLAPLTLMLKSPGRLHEHYLLVVLPAPYLVVGVFLAWSAHHGLPRAMQAARRRWPRLQVRLPLRVADRYALATLLLVSVPGASQAFGVGLQLATVSRGHFDGRYTYYYTHYGIPLESQRSALRTADQAAHAIGARVFVATSTLHEQSLGYLAATDSVKAAVYDGSSCLLAPASGSAPAMMLATPAAGSLDLLPEMSGVRAAGTVPVRGSTPLLLYDLPAGAQLVGETPVAPPSASVHLAGYTVKQEGAGMLGLALHWSGSPPSGERPDDLPDYWYGEQPGDGSVPVATYLFTVQPIATSGAPVGLPVQTTCAMLPWGTGSDVFTWMRLPERLPLRSPAAPVAGWRISVQRQLVGVARPALGPVRFETGDVYLDPLADLPGTTVIPVAQP
jgi:hypothetical protein